MPPVELVRAFEALYTEGTPRTREFPTDHERAFEAPKSDGFPSKRQIPPVDLALSSVLRDLGARVTHVNPERAAKTSNVDVSTPFIRAPRNRVTPACPERAIDA